MASYHTSEHDPDSVASSPRSDHHPPFPPNRWHADDAPPPRLRFMCSFGGRILPRPHDNQLRYVGGETRIVAVHRSTNFSALISKLSKLSNTSDITLKYQLPNEDLDSLISVTTDEDVENMIEEYDRLLAQTNGSNSKATRLRLFLFASRSPESSISSLLDGSSKREHWFLDALNGGLERGRSEVSSIVSEVPDYLFGLDNSDDPKPKARPLLSEQLSAVSDPGSPLPPLASSPYCSTSSAITYLPPVKTKPEMPPPAEIKENPMEGESPIPPPAVPSGTPVWHYIADSHVPGPAGPAVQPIPVYYIAAAGNVPIQPVPMPAGAAPYVQKVPPPVPPVGQIPPPMLGQIPVGFRQPVPSQMYSGGVPVLSSGDVRPVDLPRGVIAIDGFSQQVYYAAARNAGTIPSYPTARIPMGSELQGPTGNSTETQVRISQPL